MGGRIRSIKPEFFLNESLYDLEEKTGLPVRLAFSGLWTQCDREGRFHWRPRRLKTQILPYDECDFGAVLVALADAEFVERYEVNGEEYGCIPSFHRHQLVNHREKKSDIPPPQTTRDDASTESDTDQDHASQSCPGTPGQTQENPGTPGQKTENQPNPSTEKNLQKRPGTPGHARADLGMPLVEGEGEGVGKGRGRERKTSPIGDVCPAVAPPTARPPDLSEYEFPVTGKGATVWCLPRSKLDEYLEAFPDLDVARELRKARQWCRDNPTKRKTPSGMLAFLTRWLSHAQNEPKGENVNTKRRPGGPQNGPGQRYRKTEEPPGGAI